MKRQTISALLLGLGALISLSMSISFLQMYLESKNLGENFIHPLGKAIDKFIGKKNFSGDEIPLVIAMFFIISIALIVSATLIYRKKDNNVHPILSEFKKPEEINKKITISFKNNKSIELPLDTFFKINEDFYFATSGEHNIILMKIDKDYKTETLNNTELIQNKSTNIGKGIDFKFTVELDIKDFKILQSIKIKEENGQESHLLIDQSTDTKTQDNFYLLEKNNDKIIRCASGFLFKNGDTSILNFNNEISTISKSTDYSGNTYKYFFDYKNSSEQSYEFSITMKKEQEKPTLYIKDKKVAPHLSAKQINDINNQKGNINQTHEISH